jgi:hypothetical protein
MWELLQGEFLSGGPISILRHWQRLGNEDIDEYPMVPFGTVALTGTEVPFFDHHICILITLFRLYTPLEYGFIT